MATSGRIMLLGATGYTGRITADQLVRSGAAPVLVGRSADSLRAMVDDLSPVAPGGRLPTFEVADVEQPTSVRRLLGSADDVLISTVGPFARIGDVAVEAVVEAGAAYVDCTGEPVFIRRVFEEYGPQAAVAGARLLPAVGYDFVPGNLAGALALQRWPGIARLDIGYFVIGPFAASSGTVGSAAGIMLDQSFSWQGGRISSERPGARVMRFTVGDRKMDAITLGGSEHFALPRLDPGLERVTVAVGWAGRWSKAASAAGMLTSNAMQVPGVGSAVGAMFRTALGGSSAAGPAPHQRVKARSLAVAAGSDAAGEPIGRVAVEGPNPYDLTAGLLTWSARMLSRRAEKGTGALGPADAFGLDALLSGCLALGLAEVD
jgi:short subunit dehydrogenase-like uncharacterized protein